MKFGGQFGADIKTVVEWMVVEGRITFDYIKTFLDHARQLTETVMCKASRVLHWVTNPSEAAIETFVGWILKQAGLKEAENFRGSHFFCNADNQEDNLEEAKNMIIDIVSDFWEESKKYWNTRQDAYDRFLQPLRDRALSHWKGGAITIGGSASVLIFDFSCGFTFGLDRYHNFGMFRGCGYAWQGIAEFSFGLPNFTIFPVMENVQDLAGHGLQFGASIVIGEGAMLDLAVNLEFACGSWAAADALSGIPTVAMAGKCILNALGWINEPKCECNQWAEDPEELAKRWPPMDQLTCKYVGPSIYFAIKRGFHIGNLPLNLPWINIPRFAARLPISVSPTKAYAYNQGVDFFDGDRVVATNSNKKCKAPRGKSVERFNLGRKFKQACINACTSRSPAHF